MVVTSEYLYIAFKNELENQVPINLLHLLHYCTLFGECKLMNAMNLNLNKFLF